MKEIRCHSYSALRASLVCLLTTAPLLIFIGMSHESKADSARADGKALAVQAATNEQPQTAEDSVQGLSLEVEMRKAEVDVLAKKLGRSLNEKTIQRINELENKFGLSYEQPVSRDTPITELAYRLATIEAICPDNKS